MYEWICVTGWYSKVNISLYRNQVGTNFKPGTIQDHGTTFKPGTRFRWYQPEADTRLDLNPWFQVGTKYIVGTHFEAGTNLKAGTRFEGGARILAGTRFEVSTNLISI